MKDLKALKGKFLILKGLGFRVQFNLKYAARCPHPEADWETALSSFLFLWHSPCDGAKMGSGLDCEAVAWAPTALKRD